MARVMATDHDGLRRVDFSSPSGYWAIGDLPDGDYTLGALPPQLGAGWYRLRPYR